MAMATRHLVRDAAAVLAAAVAVLLVLLVQAAAAGAQAISVDEFDGGAFRSDGTAERQAGSRPHTAAATIEFATIDRPTYPGSPFMATFPVANAKDIEVGLPAGFVGNPLIGQRCTTVQLAAVVSPQVSDAERCPPEAQVGLLRYQLTGSTPAVTNVYNLVPPPGVPAMFGITTTGLGTNLFYGSVRSDGDYGVDIDVRNLSQGGSLLWSEFVFWGVPADPVHDDERGVAPNFAACATDPSCSNPSGDPLRAFLSLPTSCVGPVETRLTVNSWQRPDVFAHDSFFTHETGDPNALIGTEGCENVPFDPTLTADPASRVAGAPSGYTFDLRIPQTDDPNGLAQAHLDETVVTLPEGVVMNPSVAEGLAGCSDAQVGIGSKAEPACPSASKIGTATVHTPLLDDPMEGEVFLGTQTPAERYRLFLVVRGPGVIVKLKGIVTPDQQTGRLTTTFDNNPQLPFDHLQLDIKGGPRAPIANPATCGPKTLTASMSPWTGNPPSVVADTFAIDQGCPPGDSFEPSFSAGSVSPIAGTFSPFSVRIERTGGKDLGRVNVKLPRGALASLKNVDVCGEAALATVASKTGVATQGSPACPAGSQVGTVTVGAGAGPNPFYPQLPGTDVSGRMFLTGPHTNTEYRLPGVPQADYGLAIEVPAVAGPFDLGTVLVRAAIFVDPVTAQITVLSDRMPRILEGVPLNVRDVRVNVDREKFATTPTSCAPKRVAGDIRAQDNTAALRSSHYQVADCAALDYRPRLGMRLTGPRQRVTGRHPGVRAVVRQTGLGEAGIKRARVVLPPSLALDPDNAQALCEFEDGTKPDVENHCPAGSVVGRARAFSPLLKKPLVGNVYFVKNVRIDSRTGNEIRTLPMIVVALRGEVAINLTGKSSTTRSGRLVNTFADVPDAPIARFNLNIKGGNQGILAVTGNRRGNINLCDRPRSHRAHTTMNGQNGMRRIFRVALKTPCAKRSGQARQGKGGK